MSAIHDIQHAREAIANNPDVSLNELLNHPNKSWTAEAKKYFETRIAANAPGTPVVLTSVAVPEPAAVATAQPVPSGSQVEEPEDEVTDEELKSAALRHLSATDSYEKTVEGLLNEFDITQDEASKFAILALEDSRYQANAESDKLREAAMKSRDEELAAKAEADHLFLENHGFKNRKRIKVSPEDEAKFARILRKKGEEAASGPKTRLTRLDFVRKKKLYWLWQHRVPFGALSTLAGDPDQGKSLISLYLAACVSRGQNLYGDTERTEAGEILMLCAEDDPEITLRPRLEAAGADLSKIHLLESVLLKDGAGKSLGERLAQLDADILAIEKVLNDNPEIKLVIIDPISSFLGNANMNREQDVRKALQPLASRARNHGLAVVMVAHFNKASEARSAMDRVGGAKALVSMGRAAWVCVPEPKKEPQPGQPMEIQDPDRRLFLKLKGNLAPSKIGGLVYTIRTAPVEVEDKDGKIVVESQPYIVWLGETADTAQEVVIEGKSKPRVGDEVKEWLKSLLETAGGYCPVNTIRDKAKMKGYPKTTYYRAASELALEHRRIAGSAYWTLPGVKLPSVEPPE